MGVRLHRGTRRPLTLATGVRLQEVTCIFKTKDSEVRAVDGVNLVIEPGEFFTLLGPSGSGKTTCMRMIGGFTLPSQGQIFIGEKEVSQLPPNKRPVNTVFQDYALFPHMTVLENVAYGLLVKGVSESDRNRKSMDMLDLVQLAQAADRKPAQLSGGQRQRIALARALVNEPEVLLLDEPLGALDLKLREQMQSELKALQRKVGITFLFITHDQHEALSMSDRVGVFNQGKLEQVATPKQIYAAPSTRFVANFIGAANIVEGPLAVEMTGEQAMMIRPEQIQITSIDKGRLRGAIEEVQYFGAFYRLHALTTLSKLVVDIPSNSIGEIPNVGEFVGLSWPLSAVHPLQ
jgi:putative spermidine/putrescine transport system ATP-binding protein